MFEAGEDKPTITHKEKSSKKGGSSSAAVNKSNNQNSEKSTLGDLDALVALKQKMGKK